jgi:Protein of unknown function (DUF4058)
MPVHDWSRVNAGLFHHFHLNWISALCTHLNSGDLPPGYYALAEQVTSGPIPDVITLKLKPRPAQPLESTGGIALAVSPPQTRYVVRAEADPYLTKVNRVAIRDPRGKLVSVIEIVSPGNKGSRAKLQEFVDKAVAFIRQGINVLVIDLLPPTRRDVHGIHKAIWDEIDDEPFELPADKRLTLASYSAGIEKVAYVEPIAVGDVLPEMPLFLEPEFYIHAPLDSTYQTTWSACPSQLRDAVLGDGTEATS